MNLNYFIENIRTYVQINKKFLMISIILALILALLTPHLWVKSKYWENNYTVSIPNSIYIDLSTKSNFTQKTINKKFLPYLETTDSIGNRVYISNNEKNNLQTFTYTLKFCPNGNLHSFSNNILKSKIKAPITITLPKDLEFTTFNINNVDCLNKFVDNSYTIYPEKNKILDIDFKAKLKTDKNVSLFKNISIPAFLITFIIFGFIFYLFLKYNLLRKLFVEPKYSIIFLIFFVFYMLNNHYAIYNTFYTYKFDIFWGGDTPFSIESIMYSISRLKHSYFFLPFYPFFDILFFSTKNLTFSLMVIFSMISALSVACMLRLLDKILPNFKYMSFILTLIFGFSFTLTTIYYSFEVYPITCLYTILLLILLINEFKTKSYNYKNMFLILLLSALAYGVSSSNIFTSLIFIVGIWIYKKDKKSILISSLVLFLLISGFKTFQSFTSSKNPWKSAKLVSSNHLRWIKPDKNLYIEEVLKMPILAQDTSIGKNTVKVFWTVFVLLNIFTLVIILRNKGIRSDGRMYILLLIALFFNLIAHYYWYPKEGFLFSQNHFSLWFANIAYCIGFIERKFEKKGLTLNNSLTIILLLILLGIEIPNNYVAGQNYQYKVMQEYPLIYPILEVNK